MKRNGEFTIESAHDFGMMLHRAFPHWHVFICHRDSGWAVGCKREFGGELYFYSYADAALHFVCLASTKDVFTILGI